MNCRSCFALSICLIVFSLSASLFAENAQAAHPPKKVTRADAAARELFRVIEATEKAPQTCQFDLTWADASLPAYFAHQIFGITVHAGLAAPSITSDYRTVIDPLNARTDAFCSPVALKSFVDERVKKFEQSADTSTQIDRTAYAFPIFNDHFNKAVVIIFYMAVEGRSRWQGTIGKRPPSLVEIARVYRRSKGHWRLTHSEQLGIS